MNTSTTVLQQVYGPELTNPSTSCFIFDSDESKHEDIYFEVYSYAKERYNLVKEGDLFLYRKPTKSSKNGKFYFFGCGRVRKIEYEHVEPGNTMVRARLDNCLAFSRWIFQDELYDYKWKWKDRRNSQSYGQFFNNYGMNKIPKEDFVYLSSLAITEDEVDREYNQIEIGLTKKVQEGEYDVPDKYANVKTRGAAQKVFSNKLREIYNNKCCITGISTGCILIGAHIIPWSKRQDTRLNPQNGLLLSVLMDRLFENGFITIDDSYTVHISDFLKQDMTLYQLVAKYEGKRIALPAHQYRPDKSFLRDKLNLISSTVNSNKEGKNAKSKLHDQGVD